MVMYLVSGQNICFRPENRLTEGETLWMFNPYSCKYHSLSPNCLHLHLNSVATSVGINIYSKPYIAFSSPSGFRFQIISTYSGLGGHIVLVSLTELA